LLGNEKEAVLKKYTDNVEAYQLYLNGLFHVNKFIPEGFIKAIEYFDAAIAIDSTYAIAYAEKSFCYINLRYFNWMDPEEGIQLCVEAAEQAIKLDDKIAKSHLAIGRIKLHHEWKIVEAVQSYKNALAINPNSAETHVQLGYCNVHLGNLKTAMEHALIAEDLDPFSPLNLWYVTAIPWGVGDYEKVLRNGRRLVELAPNFFSGHWWLGMANLGLKRYKEAVPNFEQSAKLSPGSYTISYVGRAYAQAGEIEKAKEVLEKFEKFEGIEINGNLGFGGIYAALGEFDKAFHYYEKAIEYRQEQMLWIKTFHRNIPEFMEDPRAMELYKQIGLPQ